jgi:hypothetical protein
MLPNFFGGPPESSNSKKHVVVGYDPRMTDMPQKIIPIKLLRLILISRINIKQN